MKGKTRNKLSAITPDDFPDSTLSIIPRRKERLLSHPKTGRLTTPRVNSEAENGEPQPQKKCGKFIKGEHEMFGVRIKKIGKKSASFLIATVMMLSVFSVPASAAAYAPFNTTAILSSGGINYYDVFGSGERSFSNNQDFFKRILSSPVTQNNGHPLKPIYYYWNAAGCIALAQDAAVQKWIHDEALDHNYQSMGDIWTFRTQVENGVVTPFYFANKGDDVINRIMELFRDGNERMPIHEDSTWDLPDTDMVFTISEIRGHEGGDTSDPDKTEFGVCTVYYDFNLRYLNADGKIATGIPDSCKTPEEALDAGAPGFSYTVGDKESTWSTGVQNLTASTINASQSYTVGTEYTVANEVSTESSYSFEEMIGSETTVSAEIPMIGVSVSQTLQAQFTASQTFGSTKSNSTSKTETDSVESAISVDLPPHTATLLEQSKSTNTMTIKYDYPVAITYKVKNIAIYSEYDLSDIDQYDMHIRQLTQFGRAYPGQESAIENYNYRWGTSDDREAAYGDKINWANGIAAINGQYGYNWQCLTALSEFITMDNSGMSGTQGHYVMYYHRPMSVMGGSITTTSRGFSSAVNGIVPLYQLKEIGTESPDFSLSMGDVINTSNIDIEGYNAYNIPYFGFIPAKGYWILLDSQGQPVTTTVTDAYGNTVYKSDVANLVINRISGNRYLEANDRLGFVYLKYMIDDANTNYTYGINNPATKNSDLTSTALVKVNVSQLPFGGTITLSGSLTGYINDPAINLDTYAGIRTVVLDKSGNKISLPLTWEAQEQNGISIKNGNELSFTTPGTYHIRARYDKTYSNWLAVTALGVRVPGKVTISASSADVVKGKTAQLKATITPSDAFEKTVTWSSSNPSVATVDKGGLVKGLLPGTSTITAKLSNGSEARCTVTVHSYVSLCIGSQRAIVNGNKYAAFDSWHTKPFTVGGRAMGPVRFIGESMGGKVTYTSPNAPIYIRCQNTIVELRLNKKIIKVIQGNTTRNIQIDVPAQIRGGRTYLPVRAISESLGFHVYYESSTKHIIVNSPKMNNSVLNTRLIEAMQFVR